MSQKIKQKKSVQTKYQMVCTDFIFCDIIRSAHGNNYRLLVEHFYCDGPVSWWLQPTYPTNRVRPARGPGPRVTPLLCGLVQYAAPLWCKWVHPHRSKNQTNLATNRSVYHYVTAWWFVFPAVKETSQPRTFGKTVIHRLQLHVRFITEFFGGKGQF